MTKIKIDKLGVGYENHIVVDNINLDVKKGQLVCLLGPNGSGKTTILRTVSTLLSSINGVVYINNKDVESMTKKDLSKILAVVLTERIQVGLLTVYELVSMGRHPHTGLLGGLDKEDHEVIMNALNMVHAKDLADRSFGELSDGEKQKVLLARALCQEPELILLDEPTTHLDIRHKIEVMNILKKLSREKNITVIYSLHEIDLAAKSADVIMMVKDGKIRKQGCPEQIMESDDIMKLYDIEHASFSKALGNIEISNLSKPIAFILAGGGSGVDIFRSFTKNDIGFKTGIIQKNDIDAHVASTMGLCVISVPPFVKINNEILNKAKEELESCKALVIADFPDAVETDPFYDIIDLAIHKKIPVYSLKRNAKLENKKEIIYKEDLTSLVSSFKKSI